MSVPPLDPRQPLSSAVITAIGERITSFLDAQEPLVHRIATWGDDAASGAGELQIVRRLAAEATAGGKRMRPAFALWGHVAAAGVDSVTPAVWTAAAALDLLHVSALVHDDVMDASDVRRGAPAAHRQFETFHAEQGWHGDVGQFGRAGAILLGDLLVMWSAEMVDAAGLPAEALARALPILHAMRSEVTLGQFLDVMAQSRPASADPAEALARAARVVEHKSARYTVLRPLQFGAAVAGGSEEIMESLAQYGSSIGRAFQYRDDVLGVFGDEAVTGKPAGDDLREGKQTVLVAHARDRLSVMERAQFDELFGQGRLEVSALEELRRLITASGARDSVEEMISGLHAQALAVAADGPFTADGKIALGVLADAAVRRES